MRAVIIFVLKIDIIRSIAHVVTKNVRHKLETQLFRQSSNIKPKLNYLLLLPAFWVYLCHYKYVRLSDYPIWYWSLTLFKWSGTFHKFYLDQFLIDVRSTLKSDQIV